MDESTFWELIENVDVASLDDGDEAGALEPLAEALSAIEEEDTLFAFHEQLSQKLYALDGESFADNAGESGDSDDGFLYARCYVVAKGRRFYESVRANPKRMPKSTDQWCEALLTAHHDAWAELTGNDAEDWSFEATVSYETGSNESRWKR
jgi:Protein of unknown function (DUF4240)